MTTDNIEMSNFNEWETPEDTKVVVILPTGTSAFAIVDSWTEPNRATVRIFTPDFPDGMGVYLGAERILERLTDDHFATESASGWASCLKGADLTTMMQTRFPGKLSEIGRVDLRYAQGQFAA